MDKLQGNNTTTVEAAYCGHLGPGTSVRIIRLSRIDGEAQKNTTRNLNLDVFIATTKIPWDGVNTPPLGKYAIVRKTKFTNALLEISR